jgi:hypothetical protein
VQVEDNAITMVFLKTPDPIRPFLQADICSDLSAESKWPIEDNAITVVSLKTRLFTLSYVIKASPNHSWNVFLLFHNLNLFSKQAS